MKKNTELMQKYKRKAERILNANTSADLRVTPFDFDIKNSIITEKLRVRRGSL